VGAIGLLAVVLAVSLRHLSDAPPIPAEEHFRLGEHLHDTGILSIDGTPALFRAPGFPFFVALVLHLRDALAPGLDGARAVVLGHGFLLALGALALFLHSARSLPVPAAFAVGLLYALNPLSLALAQALTYPTLHVVLVTGATIALTHGLRDRARPWWILGAGLLWGATTLVRPVSLILPPFVFLLARWTGGRGSWRASLRLTGLFTLGLALVIAPYTIRNYRVSGRLVIVNAQEGFSLWGLAATRNPAGDFEEWAELWGAQGIALFSRATGSDGYSTEALYANTLAANDAFRHEAFRNLRREPARVAANSARNFYEFNADSMGWWLDYRDYVGEGGAFHRRIGPAKVVLVALLLAALLGLGRGLRDGETQARVVATLYAMFCLADCMGFHMARYNYVRLALALLAIPLALRLIAGRTRPD
jgi:4-amino-4-deoxy-L-arabinose transferase-like glycosyltransferase